MEYCIGRNLSIREVFFWLVLAFVVWKVRKKNYYIPLIYSIFLIIYITLLRRTPGYDEHLRLKIGRWEEADFLAGVILNTFLYIPLGYTGYICRKRIENKKLKKGSVVINSVLMGICLSICCEILQYFTKRGWADINDVLFNIIGTITGVVIACKTYWEKN